MKMVEEWYEENVFGYWFQKDFHFDSIVQSIAETKNQPNDRSYILIRHLAHATSLHAWFHGKAYQLIHTLNESSRRDYYMTRIQCDATNVGQVMDLDLIVQFAEELLEDINPLIDRWDEYLRQRIVEWHNQHLLSIANFRANLHHFERVILPSHPAPCPTQNV